MTNYLYIPLGGNRKGELKTLRNLFIVFLASGIWHGAGWNFVIWGILHGICILIHKVWKNTGRKLPKIIGWFITMNLVNIFWIFFRAESLESAIKVLRGMVDISSIFKFISIEYKISIYNDSGHRLTCFIFVLSGILSLFFKNSINKKESIFSKYEICLYISISIMFMNRLSTFLCFNF